MWEKARNKGKSTPGEEKLFALFDYDDRNTRDSQRDWKKWTKFTSKNKKLKYAFNFNFFKKMEYNK